MRKWAILGLFLLVGFHFTPQLQYTLKSADVILGIQAWDGIN